MASSPNIISASLETTITTKAPVSSGRDQPSLLFLPDELLLEVVKNADVASTITLRQTCHKLRSITPTLQEQPVKSVCRFLVFLEHRPQNIANYACFSCLNLQPRRNFMHKRTKGHFGKGGLNSLRRMCLACQSPQLMPGNHFAIDGGQMAKCWWCERFTVGFCRDCKWCLPCAEQHRRLGLGQMTKVLTSVTIFHGEVQTKVVASQPCAWGHWMNTALTDTYVAALERNEWPRNQFR